MKILIKGIPEEGSELHFDAKKDEWFLDCVRDSLKGAFQEGERHFADLFLVRTGSNVSFAGSISVQSHLTCSRCLKDFCFSLHIPVHLTIAPLFESERELKIQNELEVELVKEDLDFSYYEGDSFDLSAMIREQIILSIPMQPVCKQNCKGLCQSCGQDLNEGSCPCKSNPLDLRWTPLKSLRKKRG